MPPATHKQHLPIERAVLRDGSTIHVRPIEPGDHDRLRRGFERLGPESRYRRFLGAITALSEAELTYFTEVDHLDHEALVAVEPNNGEIVGVARYVRLAAGSETAEVAMAVADDWQGRGVATFLLDDLRERAQAAGIEKFIATCMAENAGAIDVLEGVGDTRIGSPADGLAELTISLTRRGGHQQALRHAARGTLRVKAAKPDGIRRP